MPDKIKFSKTNLSITYNIFDNSFFGDTKIRIDVISIDGNEAVIETDSYFNFNPDSIIESENIEINPGPNIPLQIGNYSFTYKVSTIDTESSFIILLSVINDNTTPPDPPDTNYYTKYWLEYKNFESNVFRLDIKQRGFLDSATQIFGKVIHNYQDKQDLFQPIIASSIDIDLEADEELTLSDLYSEDEFMYQAVFKRNDEVIFVGFLRPDGISEDWVSNRWNLKIDAYDGLSTLKNLSFVTKNEMNFVGKLSILEVIKGCLDRTNLNLPINISIEVYYDTYFGSNILEETYVNTERYYQDAKNIMDCESVLKSLLQIFNASIIQMNGEWWVYRSIDLKDETYFAKYIDGELDSFVFYHPNKSIGSQINGFETFHCNANQRKTIDASVQAYRIYYKYGNAANVLQNGSLAFEGSGLNIPGWTVNQVGDEVKKASDTGGLWSESVNYGDDVELLTLNQNIDIANGDNMVFTVQYSNNSFNTGGLMFSLGVGGKWFNIRDGVWQDYPEMNFILNADRKTEEFGGGPRTSFYGRGNAGYELTVQSPVDGKLEIKIWRDQAPADSYGGHLDGQFSIFSLSLAPEGNTNIKGRYYTASRNTRKSTVTKENITVYNGDSDSSLYVGTIFKDDQSTGTTSWYREGRTESLDLLAINAEDNLRISPRPMMVFEGDIFGYIPYLSVVSINNIQGKFQPIKYSYDTFENVIKLNSKEFSSEFLNDTDFSVIREDDNGEETKVTIK